MNRRVIAIVAPLLIGGGIIVAAAGCEGGDNPAPPSVGQSVDQGPVDQGVNPGVYPGGLPPDQGGPPDSYTNPGLDPGPFGSVGQNGEYYDPETGCSVVDGVTSC